ncbi:hypothetical protein HYT00_02975 [Candidatus Giovannonibacteria bacterium]|nr:hypothetical protein [Candidatus Giovannonibacteria bacterium]
MIFSKKKESKNILVVDIGSSSVNYFVFASKPNNEITEFSGIIHSRLPLLENPEFKHIERHVKKALGEASQELQKKNKNVKLDAIYVVVSAPWYLCETKFVKISRREKFKITSDLLNKLMAEEIELFKRKSSEKFSTKYEEVEIVEYESMRFIVNGYPIKNPFGKKVQELEVSIYLSAVLRSFKGDLEDILRHFFGGVEIKIVTEPYPLFLILSEILNTDEGFIVVDVGGEVTEVYLVQKGILENVKTFIWGGNLVVRRLASLLDLNLGEASSLFKLSSNGELKPDTNGKITKAVEGICSQWQNLLAQSLSGLRKNSPLPQTLVLLGGVAGSEVLKGCANSTDFASFTILGKPFNIVTFKPENFDGRVPLAGIDRKDPQMTLPLLLALSASKYAWKK